MANAGWEEEDLDEISRGSCLTKLALELGLELESQPLVKIEIGPFQN